MADNVAISAGVGTTIATKDIGGVQFEKQLHYDVLGNPVEETAYRYLDLGNTGQIVKNAPGRLYTLGAWNLCLTGALRFLKLYDKATAATSSDTPLWTIPLLAGQPPPPLCKKGLKFTLGLSIRATTGIADNDTNSPATNEVPVALGFQ